ncbi:MAG: AAA family ATPase [Gemmatimonadetes bacterium]|nr:AAA family ATPase [Gemmatimonadota bacterium]
MRFTRIEAIAFGCHRGRTLELGPGLNVIHGANETGKSTWLAAAYAAFCGIRRAKGQPKKEDREFEEQFRPWAPVEEWKVRATVTLDDGRCFDVERDLAGGSERIRDAATGACVEHEMIFEGAADGAHWLGLQRPAFRAVAFVNQANILSILDEAESLQYELQRAAQGARAGGTVARAIDRLREFRGEFVGLDMKGAVKPLKLAIDRVAECGRRLREERDRRADWERLLQTLTQKETEAAVARRRLERARAAVACEKAARAEEKANRARALHEQHPSAPPSMMAEAERLRAIEQALDGWEQRPAPIQLTGPTAATIGAEIEGLPAVPAGDQEPHASAVDAFERLRRERDRIEQLGSEPIVDEPVTTTATAREIEGLALELEIGIPVVGAGTTPASDEEQTHPPTRRPRSVRGVAIAGGIAVAGGMVLVGMQKFEPGAMVAAAGLLALWFGLRRSASSDPSAAVQARGDHGKRLAVEQARTELLVERARVARARCDELGVPTDPAALRSIAASIERRAEQVRQYETWKSQHDARVAAIAQSEAQLRDALMARGEVRAGDADSAWNAYRESCRERREIARRAETKAVLEKQLALREQAERQAAEVDRLRATAEERVLAIAARLGARVSNAAEAVPALRAEQEAIRRRLREHERAVHDWEELQALLEGSDLPALIEGAAAVRREADALVRATGIDPSTGIAPPREEVERVNAVADQRGTEAAELRGQLDARGQQLHAPGEMEEALAEAEAELARVRRLEETIETTLAFLQSTEDRIHREIAPRLADDLTKWLPRITTARYVEARVDPQSLEVRVRESATGDWRKVSALSYGTREQVYLLLRTALVGYIAPAEYCPLLLDEVTAFCDVTREMHLLETLLELSRDRQIILCTHADGVAAWARRQHEPVRVIRL